MRSDLFLLCSGPRGLTGTPGPGTLPKHTHTYTHFSGSASKITSALVNADERELSHQVINQLSYY